MLHDARGDWAGAAERARESMAAARSYGEEWIVPSGQVCLGFALTGLGAVEQARRLLAEAVGESLARSARWAAGLGELGLARAWLTGPGADPAAALAALRRGLRLFERENDVGNVLTCLHTGAYALALSGRREAGGVLLAAVRRQAVRHGVDPDLVSPSLTARMDRVLGPADRAAAAELTRPEMIALLEP